MVDRVGALREHVERAVHDGRYVGLAVALVRDGRTTFAHGWGRTSAGDGSAAVTPGTLFAFGSISKTLTALLVLRLREQGLVDLDAPVATYLPRFVVRDDPRRSARITLRHVLGHTTGLPSGGKDHGATDVGALRRFVHDDLTRYRFLAEPGEVHRYSNTAVVLAGHVAEVVTGRTYEDAVAEHVLDPLGMTRTTFALNVAATYPLALPHTTDDDGRPSVLHRFPENRDGNPAGFGLGPTTDLARLATVLVDGRAPDGSVFLPPDAIEEMRTPQASRHVPGYESGYGLALYTGHWRGHRCVGHGGLLASYNCLVEAFPEHGTGLVLQTCWNDGTDVTTLIDLLHEAALDGTTCRCSPAPAPEPVALQGLTGRWLDVHAGVLDVAEDGEGLVVSAGGTTAPVRTGHGTSWDGRPLGVVRRPDGTAAHLVLDGEPAQPFTAQPFEPDDIGWAAGEYAAWEVDTDPIRLRVEDGELVVDAWLGPVRATRVGPATWVNDDGLVEVLREGDDVVLVLGGGARLVRR